MDSINWDRKTLDFIRDTVGNFHNFFPQNDLIRSVQVASKVSGASETFLLSQNEEGQSTVLFSHHPKKIGKLLYFNFLNANSEAKSIQLIKTSSANSELSALFEDSLDLLQISLKDKEFNGILILGFEFPLISENALLEFADIVRKVCVERIHYIGSNSLNEIPEEIHHQDHVHFGTPDSVILIEDEGDLSWLNPSAAELFKLPQGQNNKINVSKAMEALLSKVENTISKEKKIPDFFLHNQKQIENWTWNFSLPEPKLLSVSCSTINWGNSNGKIWTVKNISYQLDSQNAKLQIKGLSNLLASVLNTSPSGIMAFKSLKDSNGQIKDFVCLMSNVIAKKILKLSTVDCRGKSLLKILPNSIKDDLFQHYKRVVEFNEAFNSEYSYEYRGEVKWFHTVALKLDDGFVVTFSDITDRKLSEEKLVKGQVKLEAILDNTTDFVWSIDQKYCFTSLNSSLQNKVFQESGKKITVGSRVPIRLFSEMFFPSGKAIFRRAFKGEHVMEETKVIFSGVETFYEFSLSPIQNEKGEITEIAVFGHDITKRKITESKVRQKSQVLNGILENLSVIIFRITAKGDFVELSGAGLKKLNVQGNKMIGKKAVEVFPELIHFKPPLKKGESEKFISRGSNGKQPYVFENHIFPDETNPRGIVGFAIDVTDQKKFELELKKAKEMAEKASLAKSYFLANQSHEIRTPINAILGFAQLIKTNPSPEESKEYLDYIISSGQILLNLLGDVLDLTKIEEGKLELVEESFYFQDVITSSLYPYQFQAKEKGLKFRVKFDKNFPKYLLGDRGKIIQIIINLVGNSIKFTKKGEILISFSCLTPPLIGEKALLRITVSDTGIGIPKNKQRKIFQSFIQGDHTIKKRFGGSGLGLSIVKSLIDLMGGEIGSQSPGEITNGVGGLGSTFWIKVPLTVAIPPSNEIDDESETVELNYNGEINVLLVDDNYLNQRLASTMLKNLGCKVTVSNNGREAIAQLKKGDFHLIFMDVQMPVMDGYETTKRIRKQLNLNLPIIGLSANVYKEDIDLCYESGMDDYLGRPYTVKSFQDKVFKWAPQASLKLDISTKEKSKVVDKKLTGLIFLEQIFNGDQEMVVEIVQDFINHQGLMITEMENALTNLDYKLVASLAHKIRSSLQTVGLNSLFDLLAEIEVNANERKNIVLIHQHFQVLKETCDKAVLELNEYLSEL